MLGMDIHDGAEAADCVGGPVDEAGLDDGMASGSGQCRSECALGLERLTLVVEAVEMGKCVNSRRRLLVRSELVRGYGVG